MMVNPTCSTAGVPPSSTPTSTSSPGWVAISSFSACFFADTAPFLRLSWGVIGGIVAGISGFFLVTMVLLFMWYRRRHRKPAILPQDVLQAEFANEGERGDPGGSSTRLTPWLNSTVPRYRGVPPPTLPSFPSGYDPAGRDDPSAYRSSYLEENLPSSAPRLVVHNVDGTRRFPNAGEEKRRLAAARRERDRQVEEEGQGQGQTQSFGMDTPLVPLRGDGWVVVPPDYYQATHPSASR